jgi:hypothetical protein
MAAFEDGANLHGERLAAIITLPQADAGGLACQFADPINVSAMRADRAVWPHVRFDKGESGIFVMKMRGDWHASHTLWRLKGRGNPASS